MLSPEYISGFCDGEASFSVTVSPRGSSWEIRPSFSVSQNEASRAVLYKLRQFFGCGYIRPSKSDNTYKYEVRSLAELRGKIIPHFKKYSLHTEKQKNFEIFVTIIQLMSNGKHLTKDGLHEIVKLLEKLNPKCKKIYDRKKLQELMNV
jgi:hypothetical protein